MLRLNERMYRLFREMEIDQSVIVIKLKEPFLAWANSVDQIGYTLAEINKDTNAYLTPEIIRDQSVVDFLEENYQMLFEQELVMFCEDETQWPADRDFATFQEWIGAEFHSVVLNAA